MVGPVKATRTEVALEESRRTQERKESTHELTRPRYLSAKRAAAALGISQATLYSYVSRGYLRSELDESAARSRRYRFEDVQSLLDRKRQFFLHD